MAVKKPTSWLVTYGVKYGTPRSIERVTVHYTSELTGLALVDDVRKQCKDHCTLHISKTMFIYQLWIHLMVKL